MWEVWIRCEESCPNYREERVGLRATNDSVKAINYSIMLRDRDHHTEIRVAKED
jgi:hypothetical protein